MKLDIILRTHNKINVHGMYEQRYCGTDKTSLIFKCVKSLIDSANNSNLNIRYFWFDDNSTLDCVEQLHDMFKKTPYPYSFVPLEERGWNASAYYQFDRARQSDADLVYMVEDDYLHFPTAIEEMVDAYINFKQMVNNEVAIHPFDDPANYEPQHNEPALLFYGKQRHWRSNFYTTNTVMCNPSIIREHWSKWYTLATEYGTEWSQQLGGNIHEGTTINKIWRNHVNLFTPIPSVALHMQFKAQMDPYLDWKQLWDSINYE